LAVSSFAQTEKNISIEDAIIGRNTYFKPESPQSLTWRDNDHYVKVVNDTLFQFAIPKGKEILLTLTEIQKAALETDGLSFSGFPSFEFIGQNDICLRATKKFAVFNLVEKKIIRQLAIPEHAENLELLNKNLTLAFTKGQNLFVVNENGEKQITFDNAPGIVNGQYVHRREFGIVKGIFLSPEGNYLAFYRKDESMVKDYPLVDFMARQAEHTPVKYPMAGMASHQVTVGIYNLKTGKTTFLQSGKPDEHYLTNISWSPDEKFIYMAELNRGQDHMQMNKYEVSSGKKTKTLFEEKSKTYVEPQFPIVFHEKNQEQFFYRSRKDGWFHLYLYGTNGKEIKQLTKGDWEVTDFYGADSHYVYFQATKESPIERHIYKADISTGEVSRLDEAEGTHQANFSPDKKYFTDNWEAFDVPNTTDLFSSKGKKIEEIHTANDPAANLAFGKNEIFTIKAADNKTDLFCRMILPTAFDPSKKYPAIIYVYGGPHAQLINNTWHNDVRWWEYYMASHGYILFTVDNRGSANRGQAFEDVTFRHLGIAETADQMKGVDYLKSLPFVDAERLGIHGWSYGGFMSLNLMLRHPETFKVGVAGGPVVDWSMYEVMYGERYMDMPQENTEGYEETNMENHVENLQGKLMLIHGAQDETVVMQHSMKFLRKCIEDNKQVDFFTYPTHPHNVRGKDRVHLMDKVSQYFFDYL
jgi:dipeptidyl-peptidase-4